MSSRRSLLRRRLLSIPFLAVLLAAAPAASPQSTAAAAGSSSARSLLVLGDSLSAEYGLPRDTGWVKLLDQRLSAERYAYEVVNASISGETTSGGLARIDELLERLHPAVVIVELGGNDGLRGLSLATTEDNLAAIVGRSQKTGAAVLVIGMRLPPNYGKAYTDRFAAIFADVSKRYRTALTPFFFEGFADRDDLFQPDRIHPTAAAQGRLLANAWPALQPLLKRR